MSNEGRNTLKAGSIILSMWGGLNFLLASFFIAVLLLFKSNAPVLLFLFDESEIPKLGSRTISTINALAVTVNAGVAAFSLLALFVIWTSLIKKQKWAYWTLLVTMGLIQLPIFLIDALMGTPKVPVSIATGALYLIGIVVAGKAIYRH